MLYFYPTDIPDHVMQPLTNDFKIFIYENKKLSWIDAFVFKILCPLLGIESEDLDISGTYIDEYSYTYKNITINDGNKFKFETGAIMDLVEYDFNDMSLYKLIIINAYQGKWPKNLMEHKVGHYV